MCFALSRLLQALLVFEAAAGVLLGSVLKLDPKTVSLLFISAFTGLPGGLLVISRVLAKADR